MFEYRTPEEERKSDLERARVRKIIDEARTNTALLMTAMGLEEHPDVVELWVDKLWDGLRDQLSAEERLVAIVVLIQDEADKTATEWLRGLRRG